MVVIELVGLIVRLDSLHHRDTVLDSRGCLTHHGFPVSIRIGAAAKRSAL